MSDNPPVDEWSGIDRILNRSSKPVETKNVTTKSYEPLLKFIDAKIEDRTNAPAYLAEDAEVDQTLDHLTEGEVADLKGAVREVQGSSDLGLLKRDISEIIERGGQVGGITKDLVGRIIKVRNFLAFDEMTHFAAEFKEEKKKNRDFDKTFQNVLNKNNISREQLAKTFENAYNSPSYERLKGGAIPKERARKEDEDTYPLFRYIASRIQPELVALKNARLEPKKERRTSTQTIEDPGIRLADYNYLYNFIYAGSPDMEKLRDAVENGTATPDQVLDLAERYTRAVQSEEYGRKLNIDTSRASQTINTEEVEGIKNGYDAINGYLRESTQVLKNQDLSKLKEAYDQAKQSGWLNKVAEDATHYDLNRLSRNKILAWFERLQTIFEPGKKPFQFGAKG